MNQPKHPQRLAYILYAGHCRRDGFPWTAKAALAHAKALR